MNKTRIKIAFIALGVIACFACAVSSLLSALKAPNERTSIANFKFQIVEVHHSSSDVPMVVLSRGTSRFKELGFRELGIKAPQSPKGEGNPIGASPFTYHFSSATVHNIGGGRAMSGLSGGGSTSNRQSSIINYQLSTAVPLLAVNSSAFSVNRELNDQSGKSVAGVAMRRIAPPDDGGSGLGGPGNIAPPDDGGELLGSPVGDVPIVFMLLLIIYYIYIGKSKTRSTHKN